MEIRLNLGARSLAIGAAVLVAAIAGILLLTFQRQEGPPSRQPDLQEVVGGAIAAPVQPGQAARPATVARVAIELSSGQFEASGIEVEPARTETLAQPVRAVASVVADESRISHVHTRVAGWIERLFVNTTGQGVRKGEPLAAIFSQDLYASQNELLLASRQAQTGLSSAVVEAARTRLRVLGMSDAEIAGVEAAQQARRLITVSAPTSGVVLRRGVTVGAAVDPSTEIVAIADLSRVWVLAEVAEGDAGRIKAGTMATLSFPASGRSAFKAAVDFVYPTLTERTRTVRVRLSVANADGQLRPGLYGTADFVAPPREALTVARDAVVYTGEAQHVFVRASGGMIEPREVKVGGRTGDRLEVTQGLSPGEQVVTTGVFLIDSESRLRASGGVGHAGHGGARPEGNTSDAESLPDSEGPTEHKSHENGK